MKTYDERVRMFLDFWDIFSNKERDIDHRRGAGFALLVELDHERSLEIPELRRLLDHARIHGVGDMIDIIRDTLQELQSLKIEEHGTETGEGDKI